MNHTTPCAKPPGYSITCNHTQLAICGTVNGEVVMGCFDPPPPSKAYLSDEEKTRELANWALGKITGNLRVALGPVTSNETLMLKSGFYRSPRTLEEVRFRMPRKEEETAPQTMLMER